MQDLWSFSSYPPHLERSGSLANGGGGGREQEMKL